MKKKIISILLLVLAVVAVVEMKKRKQGSASGGCPDGLCPQPISEKKMFPVAQQEHHVQEDEKSLPKLVDLGAGKCVPCKAMAPILEELDETLAGQLDVVFIDVWENEAANEEYGVRMIPTQIFYDEAGRELFRHEGFYSREDILGKWQELGFNFK